MRPLAELDVLVVDCQATGASPAFGHVLELGWGVQRAGETVITGARAHWIALPDGHRVPSQVRKITGYDPAFAAGAMPDREAWRELRSAVAEANAIPTVIHYARFELAFLRDWAERFEPDGPFPLDAVCVHAVARRLYPDLPRQSIRALAGYLGYSLELARRSLGHVEATAFVWQKVRSELLTRGVTTWEDLHAFLAERPARRPTGGPERKTRYPLEPERYRSLPDAPGVYRFLRSNGDVLYVGKAGSLKRRVGAHFGRRAGTPLAPEMLTQVGDIQVTVVPSALEAALLENDTIKALRPPYNVQLTPRSIPVWYDTRDFDGAVTVPDDQHPVGPVSAELSLRPLGALITLVTGAGATAELRSQAVGVSALFTPDEGVFAAGFAKLVERHPELGTGGATPRHRVLELAKKLLAAAAAPEEGAETAEPREWDPARVARHVERALVQAYRSYRRAHWLRLLHDSDVVYREPASERTRLLRVRDGAILETRDVPFDHVPFERLKPPLAGRRASFDRTRYECLRVLTTELKRIVRDGGNVSVHWGPKRRLPARLIAGTLSAT
jgi:DNA polymerase III subunit epsilon